MGFGLRAIPSAKGLGGALQAVPLVRVAVLKSSYLDILVNSNLCPTPLNFVNSYTTAETSSTNSGICGCHTMGPSTLFIDAVKTLSVLSITIHQKLVSKIEE